jgi:hypothetical protein
MENKKGRLQPGNGKRGGYSGGKPPNPTPQPPKVPSALVKPKSTPNKSSDNRRDE